MYLSEGEGSQDRPRSTENAESDFWKVLLDTELCGAQLWPIEIMNP
jgi:hypothetical protein